MRTLFLIIVSLLGFSAYGQQPKAIINSIGMKLILIHPGEFTMGSPDEEMGRNNNETQHELEHEVTISKSFYIGSHEVPQEYFEEVMGSNPSQFKGPQKPVESVSWTDALSFCQRLSNIPVEKAAGREYRLPTEAEWEYACRASSTTSYSFGNTAELLEDYAWFGEGRGGMTHPVGGKKPNRWGLYDMHGNVFEWCQDEYEPYSVDAKTDPQGPRLALSRVFRGGCWFYPSSFSRSACRNRNDQLLYRNGQIGFRVAMGLPTKQPEATSAK